jgi:hypothetical protein
MPFSRLTPLLLGLALAFLASSPALAQGHVFGTVKDADGHAIKGATITAENPNASPSSATATSDAKGQFSFLGLRGGVWIFTVQAPGYDPTVAQAVTRTLGTNEALPLVLLRAREISPPGPLTTLDVPALQRRLDDAAALESDGKLDEAIKMYRTIATDVPTLTMVHLQLGILYERTSDAVSAAAEYNTILKSDPGNAKARVGLERLARKH